MGTAISDALGDLGHRVQANVAAVCEHDGQKQAHVLGVERGPKSRPRCAAALSEVKNTNLPTHRPRNFRSL
jgi:hypothetical protein